jgi:outer membrane protein
MKLRSLASALLIASTVSIPLARAAEIRVGVVNVQEVLDTIEEGKKARETLEKALFDRKKAMEDQQKEYRRLEEAYEKQKLVLAPAALEEKRKDLETKKADLQRAAMTAQMDMSKKERELTDPLFKKIQAVVEKVGRDGGYGMILEKSQGGVIYHKDGFDVTKQVIDEYNKSYKK